MSFRREVLHSCALIRIGENIARNHRNKCMRIRVLDDEKQIVVFYTRRLGWLDTLFKINYGTDIDDA